MRTRLLAVAIGAAVAGTASAGASAVASKPALRLVGKAKLQGRHFRGPELVRLTFASPTFYRHRQIRVGATGAFHTRLPAYDACVGPLVVLARGSAGDEAKLRLPKRTCPR